MTTTETPFHTQDLQLYQYWRSSCSWRVRWALNFKEIPYNTISINLKDNEHHSSEWHKNHPGGLLPQLHWKNHILSQSPSIIEWLEETVPHPPLLPTDPIQRQKIRQLSYTIACDTQPLQNLRLLQKAKNKQEHAQKWIRLGLTTFQSLIEPDSEYSYGSQITMADLYLIPQWYNAQRFAITKEEFPHLDDIYQKCIATPACFNASPEKQFDATQ